MQKLLEESKNTPTSASQACSSVSKPLNKEETLSVTGKALSTNASEENQHQHTDGLNVIVYVLHQDGTPLMPCTTAKARHLLKQKKAKVVSRKPFTIQLSWDCEKNVQPIELGIDSAYKEIGFSATTNKKELISGEVKLRTDITKLLKERRMYRRLKRSKLWYRPARFLNRKKNDDWLAPSIQHKLDSHIRLVKKIKKLLPITETTVEVANFDIQKIKNHEIVGEQYQQGEQNGYWNVREYILYRDNHECQNPKCRGKTDVLNVHHIGYWKGDRSDRPDNLVTLCRDCNDPKNHADGEFLWGWEPKSPSFRPEAFMISLKWRLVNALGCKYTYGHITKSNRIALKLPKSHVNDAFIIAGGTNQERCRPYEVKQVRRNNRCLQINRKGFKPSIRRQHYNLQPNDLVRHNNKEYLSKGVHCKGTYIYLVDSSENSKRLDVNIKKVKLICYGKGMQFISWLKPCVSLG